MRWVLDSHRKTSIRIDPIAFIERLSRLLEALEELGFIVAGRASKVVIIHEHMLQTFGYQSVRGLILKVNMLDEAAHLDLSTFNFTLNGITGVNIAAVDINWTLRSFIHCDSLDLACLFFGSLTQHHEQIVWQKNLSIVKVTKLINSGTDLNLFRNIDGVNFKLAADWTFTCFAGVQREGHLNAVLFSEFVRDLWMSRIRLQILGSVDFLNSLYCTDESFVSDKFSILGHFCLCHSLEKGN